MDRVDWAGLNHLDHPRLAMATKMEGQVDSVSKANEGNKEMDVMDLCIIQAQAQDQDQGILQVGDSEIAIARTITNIVTDTDYKK